MHDGHRDRIRQRFEKEGLSAFTPHQVLEFLLFHSIPRRDTNEIAHLLIKEFGSLDRVMDAPLTELMKVDGIGYNSAILLKLVPQLAQYYNKIRYDHKDHKVYIKNSDDMGEYFCAQIGLYANERFAVAALDSQRCIIDFKVFEEGMVTKTTVRMYQLAEFAINSRAASIIISHNHVSGNVNPSQADRDTTREVCKALSQIGVPVMDHIIVAGSNYYSFSANGILPI